MSVPYQTLIDVPAPQGYPPSAPALPQAGEQPAAAPPVRLHFWAEMMRSRPQQKSVSAATGIFVTAGLHIAYSVGFEFIQLKPTDWTHMHTCWFFGAIIGSLIGPFLVHRFSKRMINFLSVVLVLVDGLCFTCAPEKGAAIIFARYCNGAAFGITLPACVAAASEESVKRLRGMTLSMEHVGLTTGMFIGIVFLISSATEEAANRSHGIFVLVYTALIVFFNLLFTVESPVYHLQKGDEAEAINCLHSLQRREIGTNEIPDLLAEHKKLLEEDAGRGIGTSFMLGLKVYPKFAVLCILTAMSFSAPIAFGVLGISMMDLAQHNQSFIIIFIVVRLLGVVLGVYLLDTVGRRSLTAFSLFAGGVLLVVFGTMFSADISMLDSDKMHQAQAVLAFYEIFAGIVATASTSYLGEAFAVSVKPYFVGASVCLQCLIQIIMLFTFDADSIRPFVYSVGIIQALFAGLFFVTTHETKDTTLREALSELGRAGMIHLS